VFADYQLLAATGTLIEYLKAPPPVDAAPTDLNLFGLPDYKVPTIRWTLPQSGSEPLRVAVPAPTAAPVRLSYAATGPTTSAFGDRFSGEPEAGSVKVAGVSAWFAQRQDSGGPIVLESSTSQRSSYAATEKPHWLLTAFSPVTK